MMVAASQRQRQLLTAGIGAVLILVMGAVLLFGFRLATQMRTSISALQTASTLQTYPETIAQQLNSLRDRLEVRAYSRPALADLRKPLPPPPAPARAQRGCRCAAVDPCAALVAQVPAGARAGDHLHRPA